MKKEKEEVVAPKKKERVKVTKEKISQLEKLADRLERMRVGDYVNNMNRTGRVIWLGFVGGVARGFGLTVGATLVIAIVFKIISMLISWNVPYLSDMMQEAKQMLEARYENAHLVQKEK
ncbi:MAG: hypothetical protein J6Y85_03980 [Alphaproteobacteria bacterium]|nr:hypothetical protein [Alphaproteobacteria bacterium]